MSSSLRQSGRVQYGYGMLTRQQLREMREAHQRHCARLRYAEARKALPKPKRMSAVRFERRLAYEAKLISNIDDSMFDVREQSGLSGTLGAVAAATVTFVGASLLKSARRVAKNTDEITASVGKLMDAVYKRLEEFSEACKKVIGMWWIIPFSLVAYTVYTKYGLNGAICSGLSILFAKFFGKNWIHLGQFFTPIKEQSASDIGALLATVTCIGLAPSKSPGQFSGELMRRVGYFNKTADGFKGMFDCALKYAEKLINVFLRMFSKEEVSFTDRSEALLQAWMDKVDEFEKVCRLGNPSLVQLQDAIQLQIEGIGFRQVLRTPHAVAACNKYTERIGVLLQAHRGALNSANAFRQQPVFVVFGGLSGVGKTSLLKNFGTSALLMAGETSAKEAISNMWQKGTTQYWNGYVGQKCLVVDDCFQEKPSPAKEDSEYMQIIRAVGNWAYPLNYADLESKGRFYFNSPLIIGTTNLKNVYGVADTVVNCPEAVVRRIQHGYWITPRDEWSVDGRLDYERLEREFDSRRRQLTEESTLEDILRCFPWEAWKAVKHDYSGEVTTSAEKDLFDLMVEVGQALKDRKAQHSENVGSLEDWLSRIEKAIPQSGLTLAERLEDEDTVVFDADFPPLLQEETEPEIVGRQRKFRELYNSRRNLWLREWMLFAKEAFTRISQFLRLPFIANCVWEFSGLKDVADWACVIDPWIGAIIFDVFGKEAPAWLARTAAVCAVLLTGGAIVMAFNAIKTLAAMAWGAISGFFKSIFGSKRQEHRREYRERLTAEKRVEQSNVPLEPAKSKSGVMFKRLKVEQLGVPPTDNQQDAIYENTYKMFVGDYRSEDAIVIGQVQFIQGNLGVMPGHFRRQLRERAKPSDELWFVHPVQSRFHFKVTVEQFLRFKGVGMDDVDIEFIAFDIKTLKSHRNILPYMLEQKQMEQLLRITDVDVRLDVADIVRSKQGVYMSRNTHRCKGMRYISHTMLSGKRTEMVVEYRAQTKEGDCGAPLCIAENRHYGGRCYIGFHIAGTTDHFFRYGYSTYVTKENAEAAIKHLGTYRDSFLEDLNARGVAVESVEAEEQSGIVGSGKLVDGSFLLIGKVNKPLSMAGQTALKPSPMQKDKVFGEPPTLPAILRPVMGPDGDMAYPMVNGLRAYQSDLECRDVPLLDGIVELATKKHREATKFAPRFIMTPEEAVVGVEGLKLKKIARDTSAGYPYRLEGTIGKKDFFGADGEYDLSSDKWFELKERVLYVIEQAKANVRLAHLFTDFLKDELRPLRKIEAVATRMISGAPLDYVIAVRMYFGTFLASMFSSYVESGMAPGINHYTEWHRLATRLLEKGLKIFGGDFSRFDSSEQPYIHVKILEYINRWYSKSDSWSPEDDRVREILWLDLIHSRHLSGVAHTLEYVVQWNKSLPSGHPLTTPVNSLYSLITLTACYVHATGDVQNMWDNVFINTFGDDNIASANDTVIEVFNQVTVSELMKRLFNLDYTSDKKGSDLVPYESIEEVTFLKRTFRMDPDGSAGWSAPLNKDSFLYIPYWFRNNRDPMGDLRRNVELMLGELCIHDQTVWDEYFPIVKQWFDWNDLDLPFTTREAARDWIKTRTDVWF